MLPFKTGAFLAGQPVQPVVLQYGQVSCAPGLGCLGCGHERSRGPTSAAGDPCVPGAGRRGAAARQGQCGPQGRLTWADEPTCSARPCRSTCRPPGTASRLPGTSTSCCATRCTACGASRCAGAAAAWQRRAAPSRLLACIVVRGDLPGAGVVRKGRMTESKCTLFAPPHHPTPPPTPPAARSSRCTCLTPPRRQTRRCTRLTSGSTW
jgi:hypothetical protein